MKITTGPKDNRNIFGPTYIISQAISKLTPENATIIFPYPYEALKNERKPYDSLGVIVAHDVLFPRVLFWEGFEDRLHLHSQKDLYAHQLRAIKKAKEGLVKYEQGKGKQKIFEKNSLYRVTYDGWHDNRCKYHEKGKSLEYLNWYICPED